MTPPEVKTRSYVDIDAVDRARIERGLSYRQLAEASHVTVSTILAFFGQRYWSRPATLRGIAIALNMSLDQLMGGTLEATQVSGPLRGLSDAEFKAARDYIEWLQTPGGLPELGQLPRERSRMSQ